MKAAIREDTNPTIYSLPSMKNLLMFISAVPGPPPPGRRPGAVGSHIYKLAAMLSPVKWVFTLVKSHPAKALCRLVEECFSFMFSNRPAVEPGYGPVNISGIYRGNGWPAPAGSVARVSCLRSAPGTASMEICPAWMPAGHWSVSPAALSCKARPVTSHLLY